MAFGVIGLAALQFIVALEGSLARLHTPKARLHFGYRALADPSKVRDAWASWRQGRSALRVFEPISPRVLIGVHVSLDFVVAACVVGMLAAVLSLPPATGWRSRLLSLATRPWGFFLLLAAALHVLTGVSAATSAHSACCRVTGANFAHWFWLGERVAIGVGALSLAASKVGLLWRALGYVYWSPATLRLLLALDLAFVVMLYGGRIGTQSEDLVERWFTGDCLHAVAAVAFFATFVGLVRASRRIPLVAKPPNSAKQAVMGGVILAAGAVVANNDSAGRGTGLFVLGVIVVFLAGLDAFVQYVLGWHQPGRDEKPGKWLRVWVAAIPGLALGLVLVRTAANNLVVHRFGAFAVLLVSGAVWLALAFAAWAHTAVNENPTDLSQVRWFVGLAAAGVIGMTLVDGPAAGAAGTIAILLASLVGVAAIAMGVRAVANSKLAPPGLRYLGFARMPVVTLILVWIMVSSSLNGATNKALSPHRITYYDARVVSRLPDSPAAAKPAATTDCLQRVGALGDKAVGKAFCDWVGKRIRDEDHGPTLPLVLVTASGGGVRAAAWTEKVLDCLFFRDDPATCSGEANSRDSWPLLFAANGASGGSVGIASAVAERLATSSPRLPTPVKDPWFRTQLSSDKRSSDALSPTLGHAVLRDGLLGAFGVFVGADRAATLEDAWAYRWHKTRPNGCDGTGDRPITDLGFVSLRQHCSAPLPIMLFNGTDVDSGLRVNVAPEKFNDRFGDDVPWELRDFLGDSQDLRLFTAAFLSARFPLISPTGRLPSCRPPDGGELRCPQLRDVDPKRVLNIVDGGYAENTGTAQVAELMQQLEPLIAAYNGPAKPAGTSTSPPTRVRLVLVEIENGELAGEKSAPALATGAGEFFRPLQALMNVSASHKSSSKDALVAAFGECSADAKLPVGRPVHVHFAMYEHPGRRLPLGWTLSKHSLDDIDKQFEVGANAKAAACFKTAMTR